MLAVLKVRAKSFAATGPIPISNGWVPMPPQILECVPSSADLIAAPLPMYGGMRIVVYNRGDSVATVTLRYE